MSIRVERIPDEPIIIYHYPERLRTTQEITAALTEAITEHQNKMGDEPVIWVIHNTIDLKIDFGVMLTMLAALTKDGPEGFNDPRLRVAAITQNSLIRFMAGATSQEQYGRWDVKIVETLDEALALAREDIARSSHAVE